MTNTMVAKTEGEGTASSLSCELLSTGSLAWRFQES